MIAAYFEDTDRLGLGRPDAEPLATETIAEIVELIEDLIDGGHAYESGGDVYFRVRSFDGYGKLSNRDPDEMDQGEEAGSAAAQGGPARLRALEGAQGGRGHVLALARGARAGPAGTSSARRWPRSCSGADFAIHGGGSDLVFPHHENEIAQTEAARGRAAGADLDAQRDGPTDAEKMSKSVGNIFQLSEAIDRFGAEAVVAFLISGHYRQPLEFSRGGARAGARPGSSGCATSSPSAPVRPGEPDPFVAERREAFLDALADDFNTPRALAAALRARRRGQPARRCPARARRSPRCSRCSGSSRCSGRRTAERDAEAEALLAERERARAERDFERADEIRDRARRARLGGPRHARGRAAGPQGVSDRPTGVEIVYGRRAGRRGAAAGAAACTASGRADDTDAAELHAARGSPDHQGVVAEVDPYPYADAAGAARAARRR